MDGAHQYETFERFQTLGSDGRRWVTKTRAWSVSSTPGGDELSRCEKTPGILTEYGERVDELPDGTYRIQGTGVILTRIDHP